MGYDASARIAPVSGSRTTAEAPFACDSVDDPRELALGRVLDRGPEREGERRALVPLGGGVAALARPRRVRALGRVAEERDARRLAAHVGVEAVLEPREALVVGADVAERGRGERALGIAARRLGHELDAGEALLGDERLHARGDSVAHAPGDPDEVLVRALELPGELLRRVLEERREEGGLLSRVGDVRRDREHGFDAGVDREVGAVGVLDDAAPRGEIDGALLLAGGPPRELVLPQDLQVDETHEEDEDPEADAREHEKGAAVRARGGAQGAALAGAGVWGGAAGGQAAGNRGRARAPRPSRG